MANKTMQMKVNGQTITLKYVPSSRKTALLKKPGVQNKIRDKAYRYRQKAASMYDAKNYQVKLKEGKTRTRAIVYTADKHAMYSNRLHNTLRKVMGG